jgi:histidinol-phosphate/aromatic aminotransferase/cobyric acid decarboxylase-like protein
MTASLNKEMELDLLRRGFSRRSFFQLSAMVAGAAAMPFFNEPALAQLSKVNAPADAVLINANENPLGPCPEAMQAVRDIVVHGGRYMYSEGDALQATMALQEGLPTDRIRIYDGSSPALHQSVLAFTSPTRPLVVADPGYEAGERAAKFIGSKVVKVPLTATYAHDVKAMLAAGGPTAGLFYICNPNNPTGTLTPQADIEWLVANKPEGSVVMIDEAYTHIAGAPFNTGLVAKGKDVVLLRTFSKIYGLAGLRAGAAIARPDLLTKLGGWGATMMPITGMAAANASLKVKDLVPARRKLIGQVREDTFCFLDKNNFKFVPSVSNCFMVDTGAPGAKTVLALQKEKVYIGRVWPAMPTYVRVTVGTADEMVKFQTAFKKVMTA